MCGQNPFEVFHIIREMSSPWAPPAAGSICVRGKVKQVDTKTGRHTDRIQMEIRLADTQTGGHTDRRTHKQADTQTGRHTDRHKLIIYWSPPEGSKHLCNQELYP